MKEKSTPSFDRFHGDDDEARKKAEEEIAGRFHDQEKAYEDASWNEVVPSKHERPMSLEEVRMVALANEVTDTVREKYGLEPRTIPSENVHFIEHDKFLYSRMRRGGAYLPLRQSIEIGHDEGTLGKMSKTNRMRIVVHEMLHMKSYNAFKMTEKKGKEETDIYRVGMQTRNAEGNFLFVALNEAITDELSKRCLQQLEAKDPDLAEEAMERRRLMGDQAETLDEEGVIHVRETSGLFGKKIKTEKLGYVDEVKALNLLVDKLFAKFPDDFTDREEVFDLFGKAAMTGRMLVLGRVMKKAFGEDAFRKIAEAKLKGTGLSDVVESL